MQTDHPNLATSAAVKGGTNSPGPNCEIYLEESDKFFPKSLSGFRLLPSSVQAMLGGIGKKYFGTVQNQWDVSRDIIKANAVKGGIRVGKQEKENKEASEM